MRLRGITAVLLLAAAVMGFVCLESTHFVLRDSWRDITAMRAEFPLKEPRFPLTGPRVDLWNDAHLRPNPPEFEPPSAGTQMSSSQVRRIHDAIHQAGEGKGINLLVFGLGHDSAYVPYMVAAILCASPS